MNDIILILGSFHILMSFLGAVGHLMTGTGLQHLLEQVYASHTVPHIMSGKAVDRARRGHMLSLCSLYGIMMSKVYDVNLAAADDFEITDCVISEHFLSNPSIFQLTSLLENLKKLSISNDDELMKNNIFQEYLEETKRFKDRNNESKTSQLWFMYMDMIDLMCIFIK